METKTIRSTLVVALILASVLVPIPASHAATETLAFSPVADTYVNANSPTSSFATAAKMVVDSSPAKEGFLRFDVSGIAGRTVTAVRLRLFQTDSSTEGGTVSRVTSNAWPESITWDTKPAIDGVELGAFGAVATDTWYEMNIGTPITADDSLSLAITSPVTDVAWWATRESANPPELLVDVDSAPASPTLSIDNVSLGETHTLTATASFTVTLAPVDPSQSVTVDYASGDVTAVSPDDYEAVSGQLEFAPGESTKTINVNVAGEEVAEADETFLVGLSGSIGAAIADDTGVGTILDDDSACRDGIDNDADTKIDYPLDPGCTDAADTDEVDPPVPPSPPETLTFNPVADTYVNANYPTRDFDTVTKMIVDSSPAKEAFLRFDVSGIAGRTVTAVRLRLFQTDASTEGGTVSRVTSNAWPESITWDTKPAIDGPQLGAFGAVAADTWYEIDLGTPITADDSLSLAITSPVTDLAWWATRESSNPPELLVDVEQTGPSLWMDDVSVIESDTGTATASFTVTLDPVDPSESVTVDYASGDVTAVSPDDYEEVSGQLEFAPGESTKTIDVNVAGEEVAEADETFLVGLSGSIGAAVADDTGVGTILDDDSACRDGIDNDADTKIDYPLDPGCTDAADTDEVDPPAPPETLTFNPVADTFVNSKQASNSFATATKLFVDGSPVKQTFLKFDVADIGSRFVTDVSLRLYQMGSSVDGGHIFTMTDTSWAENISYNTRPAVDGTEIATIGAVASARWYDIDLGTFIPTDGLLSLAITSPHTNDAAWASREHANKPQLIVDVASTMPTPALSIDDVSVTEIDTGIRNATFTVTLDPPEPIQTVTANYATSDGTAQALTDYQTTTGSISFAPGETTKTIVVPTVGDTEDELSEDYFVDLSDVVGAGVEDGHGIGTIVDNDTPVLGERTLVSDTGVGSSDPTAFANNRRVAVTAGGRVLVVHGYHSKGVMLKWRDGTGPWNPLVIYDASTTGDWPASIAIERDSTGNERAWIVFSGDIFNDHTRPVYMRRLRDLDAAGGPVLGALVTVEGTTQDGNDPAAARPDIAFETALDGSKRGVIVWTRANVAANNYAIMTKWFTDLNTDTPTFSGEAALFTGGSNANITGTLVSTPAGVRVVARTDALRVYAHDAGAPLNSWTTGSATETMAPASRASAVTLSSGEILATAEVNRTTHIVKVVQFSNTGSNLTTLLNITGYEDPTLATDGTRAWVVMMRSSDGLIVSREFSGAAWTVVDRVEVNSAAGGDHAWPNLLRDVQDKLIFIVQGSGTATSKKVWGITRSV